MTLIGLLSEQEQERDFIFLLKTSDTQAHWERDKNIKDVIVHLYEWH
ncbi:ClbS/DfsB family four-helix bundle protein [Secundilactobacillus kimchicus]